MRWIGPIIGLVFLAILFLFLWWARKEAEKLKSFKKTKTKRYGGI